LVLDAYLKNLFTFKKLKMRENIMIERNFGPLFYMTVLNICKAASDMINPREYLIITSYGGYKSVN